MRKSHKFLVKLLILLILPMTFITSNPIKAKAHDAFFIQVLLDSATMTFTSTVENDNLSNWKSFNNALETGHREVKFGDYSSLKKNSKLSIVAYGNAETNKDEGGTADVYNPYMVFTFPSAMERHSFLGVKGLIRNHATGEDSERAENIATELTRNLNQTLAILFGGNPAPSVEELEKAVAAILVVSGSGNGITEKSQYGNWEMRSEGDNIILKSKTNGTEHTFKSRMIKGYISPTLEDGSKSHVYGDFYKVKSDVTYISMGMLAAQGMHLNEIHEYNVVNTPKGMNQSVITQKFKEFLSEVILSIRNVLGLKSLDHMIFDTSGAGTYGGIMSYGWLKVATTFHLIFQAIAWSILTLSIIKILIQNNLATINVYSRISMMESIKKLLFTAALLASSILIINILARLNSQFVSIFATMRTEKSLAGSLSNYSSIGTVIMSFYYLVITIYFNFVYIMRGLTVAILIASAPLFIISIPFASAESKLFMTWVKELTSNIFLQSFHAFIFALILSLTTASAGIEMAVVSFSLIPLSAFFRNLITGGDTLSSRLQDGTASGVLKTGSSAAAGFMFASQLKGKTGSGKGADSAKGFNMEKSTGAGGAGDESVLGNHATTKDTVSSMNTTSRDFGQGGSTASNNSLAHNGKDSANNNNTVSNDFYALSGKDKKSAGQNILSGAGTGLKATAKLAGGAALATAGVGVGIGLAMSGVNPTSAAMIGGAMAGKGIGWGKSGVQDVGNDLKDDYNEYQQSQNQVSNGNIVNAEKMQNGNTVIDRDRNMLAEQEGVISAEDTDEGNIAITYNQSLFKPGSHAKENIGYISKDYAGNESEFRRRGVANVTRDGANPNLITVHYNKAGQKELGVTSMTTTERRIKETKRPSSPKTTRFNYDPREVVVPKRNEEPTDE